MDEERLEKAMAALQGGDGNALADIYTLTSKGRGLHVRLAHITRLSII
jgi:hypothetical protein